MRKADLSHELFEKVGISKRDAARIVDNVFSSIRQTLKKGESVKITGFGCFMVRSKSSRKGRNPRTGEEIGIAPRRVVSFRPSQVFKRHVNHS
tara:strand:- start:468 stop:746 length:279 start_codon:yes stop_codon:yes gene_type:complete